MAEMGGKLPLADGPLPARFGSLLDAPMCVAMVAFMQRILVALAITGAGQASVAAPVATVISAGANDAPRPIIIGQSYRMKSAILGGSRVINVQLPEHYGDTGRTFPVLYLLDGGEHEDFVHIAGLAQINAAYGQGQEMIVVGIEGVDRRHDLTSPSTVAGDLKAAPTSGGADAYRRFLTKSCALGCNIASRPMVERS